MKRNFLACDLCGETELRLAEDRILVKTLNRGGFAVDVCGPHAGQLLVELQRLCGHAAKPSSKGQPFGGPSTTWGQPRAAAPVALRPPEGNTRRYARSSPDLRMALNAPRNGERLRQLARVFNTTGTH